MDGMAHDGIAAVGLSANEFLFPSASQRTVGRLLAELGRGRGFVGVGLFTGRRLIRLFGVGLFAGRRLIRLLGVGLFTVGFLGEDTLGFFAIFPVAFGVNLTLTAAVVVQESLGAKEVDAGYAEHTLVGGALAFFPANTMHGTVVELFAIHILWKVVAGLIVAGLVIAGAVTGRQRALDNLIIAGHTGQAKIHFTTVIEEESFFAANEHVGDAEQLFVEGAGAFGGTDTLEGLLAATLAFQAFQSFEEGAGQVAVSRLLLAFTVGALWFFTLGMIGLLIVVRIRLFVTGLVTKLAVWLLTFLAIFALAFLVVAQRPFFLVDVPLVLFVDVVVAILWIVGVGAVFVGLFAIDDSVIVRIGIVGVGAEIIDLFTVQGLIVIAVFIIGIGVEGQLPLVGESIPITVNGQIRDFTAEAQREQGPQTGDEEQVGRFLPGHGSLRGREKSNAQLLAYYLPDSPIWCKAIPGHRSDDRYK
jgi:hypothetical protein